MFAVPDRIRNQTLVEGRQLAISRTCESEQVGVRDLPCIRESRGVDVPFLQKGNVVGPEVVAWNMAQAHHKLGDLAGTSGRVWVATVAGNTQNAVLGKGAGRPGSVRLSLKPFMCGRMPGVIGIDQSKQDVDVQQISDQGVSSSI